MIRVDRITLRFTSAREMWDDSDDHDHDHDHDNHDHANQPTGTPGHHPLLPRFVRVVDSTPVLPPVRRCEVRPMGLYGRRKAESRDDVGLRDRLIEPQCAKDNCLALCHYWKISPRLCRACLVADLGAASLDALWHTPPFDHTLLERLPGSYVTTLEQWMLRWKQRRRSNGENGSCVVEARGGGGERPVKEKAANTTCTARRQHDIAMAPDKATAHMPPVALAVLKRAERIAALGDQMAQQQAGDHDGQPGHGNGGAGSSSGGGGIIGETCAEAIGTIFIQWDVDANGFVDSMELANAFVREGLSPDAPETALLTDSLLDADDTLPHDSWSIQEMMRSSYFVHTVCEGE